MIGSLRNERVMDGERHQGRDDEQAGRREDAPSSPKPNRSR